MISTKIFTIVFLILGIAFLIIGIYIILSVSGTDEEYQQQPAPTLITPTPDTTVSPTPNQSTGIETEILEGSIDNVSSTIKEYNLSVLSASETNPLPDLQLIVKPLNLSTNLQNEPTEVIISPSLEPIQDNSQNLWKYKFIWDGFSELSNLVVDGAYTLTLFSSALGSVPAPIICSDCEYISVSDDVPNSAIFTISKNSIQTCTQNGDVNISYTIRVRNIGAQSGQFNLLEDELDPKFNGTPIAITPQGQFQNKKISWEPTNINSNQVKEFTYSITIPNQDIPLYQQTGFVNTATLSFRENSKTSFTLRTNLICQTNITPTPTPTNTPTPTPPIVTNTPTPIRNDIPVSRIPETSVYINNNILLGFVLILMGIMYYKLKNKLLPLAESTNILKKIKINKNNKNHKFEVKVYNEFSKKIKK